MFKVGQLLVCSNNTIGVIRGVYKRDHGGYFYSIEFSDDNINRNFYNAYFEDDNVEQWYQNYIDLKVQQ